PPTYLNLSKSITTYKYIKKIKKENLRYIIKIIVFMVKRYLSDLRFVWNISLIISVLLVIVSVLYAFSPLGKVGQASIHYMYAIQVIVLVLALFLSKNYKSRLKNIVLKDFKNKLLAYKKLNQNLYLLYILLVLFACMSIFFVGSAESLILPIVLLLLLFLKRPYLIKFKMELNLSDQDLQKEQ
ncbi:MAG: hypothetical protein Q4Q06_03490, partial [Bacteroidota bacterium]|nr:hypothetical protein [Bacteroidota bacterium]